MVGGVKMTKGKRIPQRQKHKWGTKTVFIEECDETFERWQHEY